MKYAFFGTPRFAAIVLEKLISAGMSPAMVVCNPDKPVGRKQIITAPPTKILAQKYAIPVFQPEHLDEPDLEYLRKENFDFAIVAAYAKILPEKILKIPKKGMIGVHPSLLPKYRGTTPIQSVILNGETETGTTLFLIDRKVDHGPIFASEKATITGSETYLSLEEKLGRLSGELLVATLPKFLTDKIDLTSQNNTDATVTKKFKTEDALVDLATEDPSLLDRKIRALNPQPGVYVIKNKTRIKILDRETIQYAGKTPRKVTDAISYLKSL